MINNIFFFKKMECFVDFFLDIYNDGECIEEDVKEIECDGNGCCWVGLSEF